MKPIEAGVLAEAFTDLGIRPGDWVFFHSSLKRFGSPITGGADAIIDTLLDAVSPGGAIAVPTHSDAGPDVYDPLLTPVSPRMGVVPHVFVTRQDMVRSCHPTHSCAALGPDAHAWMRGHESAQAVGEGSPLDKLRLHPQGKALLIGVGLDRLTLLHLAESLARMPYIRLPWREDTPRRFQVRCEGRNLTYDMSECPGCSDQFVEAEPALREAGLIRETHVGDARLMVMPARQTVDVAMALLREDPRLLLNPPTHCDWCHRANAALDDR